MGTPCEIQLFVEDQELAQRIAALVIADVQRLEGLYSRYKPDSLLSKINAVATSGGSITVDAETAGLLDYAATCHQQSDGLFDISSGILRQAWRFETGQLPDQSLIKQLLKRVGWHKLRWHAPVLEFPLAGMALDFGGIVKEYAVDRAAALSWHAGARHGLINLGGDIKLIGPRPGGEAWQVGIHHPRQKQALASTLALCNGAVASSGDYERCIIVNGQRYGHILNPKTGWPVRRLASVSVVGDFCVVAGSASTIAMLKEEQGPCWLQQLGLPHQWIDVEGNSGGSLDSQNSRTC